MGDLLRAPGRSPTPILSRSMLTTLPGCHWSGNRSSARCNDHASQTILHKRRQQCVDRQLCQFRPSAARSACHCAGMARYSEPPLRAAALRRSSREIVDAERPICRAISRTPPLCACSIASSSRSAKDRYRPDAGFDDGASVDGGMPPASRNHRVPTACDTPAPTAASSLDRPAAIDCQNPRCSSRRTAFGRPGDLNPSRAIRSEPRIRTAIATPPSAVATAGSIRPHNRDVNKGLTCPTP